MPKANGGIQTCERARGVTPCRGSAPVHTAPCSGRTPAPGPAVAKASTSRIFTWHSVGILEFKPSPPGAHTLKALSAASGQTRKANCGHLPSMFSARCSLIGCSPCAVGSLSFQQGSSLEEVKGRYATACRARHGLAQPWQGHGRGLHIAPHLHGRHAMLQSSRGETPALKCPVFVSVPVFTAAPGRSSPRKHEACRSSPNAHGMRICVTLA